MFGPAAVGPRWCGFEVALCAKAIELTPQTSRAGLALTGVGRRGGGYLNPQGPRRGSPRSLANHPAVSVSSECHLAALLQKLCWHGEGTLRPKRYKGQGRGQGRGQGCGSFPASPRGLTQGILCHPKAQQVQAAPLNSPGSGP